MVIPKSAVSSQTPGDLPQGALPQSVLEVPSLLLRESPPWPVVSPPAPSSSALPSVALAGGSKPPRRVSRSCDMGAVPGNRATER